MIRARVLGLLTAAAIAVASPSTAQRLDALVWRTSLGVDRWHAEGFRGRGVAVAVLDSGFRGWRSWLGSVLPSEIAVRSFRSDRHLEARASSHGILCAEVIHALAPEAELLFANWEPDQPDTFIEAVAWARRRGARVLSCSVIMPAWSDGEGGGRVHAALRQIIGAGDRPGDMLCCACAGNTAQRHWSGPFRPNEAGWHQWRSGQCDNVITPWSADERVSVELSCSAGDYRLVVIEVGSGREIGQSPAEQGRIPTADGDSRVVRFPPRKDTQYSVRVQSPGSRAGTFHIAVLGGWLSEHCERGSIPFPGDGPEFLAVGAWDESGRRAAYSSCGPNSVHPKPDFVARVSLPTATRSQPFSGTSAAAPQLAGLAALLWSRNPSWTAEQVRSALRSSAVDVGELGHDFESGYGLIRLP
jgi:subtilisin family serine protease